MKHLAAAAAPQVELPSAGLEALWDSRAGGCGTADEPRTTVLAATISTQDDELQIGHC